MNKKDRLIHLTEQRMLGHEVLFDDRWDHHLALEALGELRPSFDFWVKHRAKVLVGYRPLTRLVVWFLWCPHSAYGPHRLKDGTLGWDSSYNQRAFDEQPPDSSWRQSNARAIALHRALQEGKVARRGRSTAPDLSLALV